MTVDELIAALTALRDANPEVGAWPVEYTEPGDAEDYRDIEREVDYAYPLDLLHVVHLS